MLSSPPTRGPHHNHERFVATLLRVEDEELQDAEQQRRTVRYLANFFRQAGVRGRWQQWKMACLLTDSPFCFTRGELMALAEAALAGIAAHDEFARDRRLGEQIGRHAMRMPGRG